MPQATQKKNYNNSSSNGQIHENTSVGCSHSRLVGLAKMRMLQDKLPTGCILNNWGSFGAAFRGV